MSESRVWSITVPEVALVCFRQAGHCQRRLIVRGVQGLASAAHDRMRALISQPPSCWQCGHTNPSGQRLFTR